MKNINKLNIDFMRHRHIAVAISAALVLLSLVAIFFLARLNLGIDFAGGTQLIVRFLEPTEIDEVRAVLARPPASARSRSSATASRRATRS